MEIVLLLVFVGVIVFGGVWYAWTATGGNVPLRRAAEIRTRADALKKKSDASIFDKESRKIDAVRAKEERLTKKAEAEQHSWAELKPGNYSVVLAGFNRRTYSTPIGIELLLHDMAGLRGQSLQETKDLVERAIHISPETIAGGISQDDAVRLKVALEAVGGKVKIVETSRSPSPTGREAIPADVRREVWRRDQGRCVDCGSREKLEFDHIIPWSEGGSNTARNLELRCESCNRRKGSEI